MKQTILITGAGGYIGSILCDILLKNDHKIVAIDNFERGFKQPLDLLQSKYGKQRIVYYQRDINESLEDVFTKHLKIETVIHLAGLSSVDESVQIPQKYFETNVNGTQNLILNMRKHNVKNIIFSSTCAVYGETKEKLIDENHPTHPINPYGLSKLKAEEILKSYGNQNEINFVIFRYFNVSGASIDSLLGDSQKPSKLLVHNVAKSVLGIHKLVFTFPLVNTPDGTPIRDYVDILDIAHAHQLAIDYLKNGGKNQIFNLGTTTGYSVLGVVEAAQRVASIKLSIGKTVCPRKGEYAMTVANSTKAKNILGWSPNRKLNDSIKSAIRWYKNNPTGWNY